MPQACDQSVEASLAELVQSVPPGWTSVTYGGRRWGLTRTDRADGRMSSLYAEELGGNDSVSANVYLSSTGPILKACEMPEEKVIAFLRGWSQT
jgi:peptide-methionine (S)-S-oxide reductase